MDTLKIEKCGHFTLKNPPNQLTPLRQALYFEVELITGANGVRYYNKKNAPLQIDRLNYYPIGTYRQSKGEFSCWFVFFSCTDSSLLACLPTKPRSIRLNAHEVQNLQRHYENIAKNSVTDRADDACSAFSSLFAILAVLANSNASFEQQKEDSVADKMQKAKEFIDYNFANLSDWRLAADSVQYSHSHFHTLFKKYFAITAHDYIVSKKLDEAKRLLITTSLKIPQIAEAIKIGNFTYFSALFKEKIGLSPNSFRKQNNPIF